MINPSFINWKSIQNCRDDAIIFEETAWRQIAELDPLFADEWMAKLGDFNEHRDISEIVRVIQKLIPSAEHAAMFNIYEAAASVRDVGMMLASLRRHGIEPVDVVPEVEQAMLLWGQRTDMVPRETVFHYCGWNPIGRRRRRFTRSPSEDGLIDAVIASMGSLRNAIRALNEAWELPISSEDMVAKCVTAARELMALHESMKITRNRVDSSFFATELRCYFEPIRLGYKSYSGAAAAQLPVGMIDHILWASDCTDTTFREFQSHVMEYQLPEQRRYYTSTLGQPSMLTRLIEAKHRSPSEANDRTTCALLSIFNVLRVFRARHLVFSKVAYNVQIRQHAMGSAGYGPDTLARILALTLQARSQLGHLAASRTSYKLPSYPADAYCP